MIYTITIKVSSHDVIARIADHLGCSVILDCRARPDTRPAKNRSTRAKLSASLGDRYRWVGDCLGGFGHITDQGIEHLTEIASKSDVLLLCACKDPGQCHLHTDVARRMHDLGHDVSHIWRDEVIPYTVLRDMTDDQSESGEYAFTSLPESLSA
jgi:hypothetical protein